VPKEYGKETIIELNPCQDELLELVFVQKRERFLKKKSE